MAHSRATVASARLLLRLKTVIEAAKSEGRFRPLAVGDPCQRRAVLSMAILLLTPDEAEALSAYLDAPVFAAAARKIGVSRDMLRKRIVRVRKKVRDVCEILCNA